LGLPADHTIDMDKAKLKKIPALGTEYITDGDTILYADGNVRYLYSDMNQIALGLPRERVDITDLYTGTSFKDARASLAPEAAPEAAPEEAPAEPQAMTKDPGLKPPVPEGGKIVDRANQGDLQYIYVLNKDFSVTAYRRGEMKDGKMVYYPKLKTLTTFAKGSEAAETIATAAGFAPKDMEMPQGRSVDAGLSADEANLINLRSRLSQLKSEKPVVAQNLDNKLKGIKLGKDMQAREKMKALEAEIEAEEAALNESLISESVYGRWQKIIKG